MGFIDSFDRRIVPNWRDFKRTCKLGELANENSKLTTTYDISYLNEYLTDWERYKTIGVAADLLNAAFIVNIKNHKLISEAANYIVANKEDASPELYKLAEFFLEENNSAKKTNQILLEHVSFDDFKTFFDSSRFYEKLAYYKRKVKFESNNAIAWVELSRMYSIIGLESKAEKAMDVACSLTPNNRYVLRSAARFFIHFNKYDKILKILQKATNLKHDPWLLSIDISLASFMNRFPKNHKVAKDLINNKHVQPFEISELASSLGTLEFINGDFKDSKKFFKTSLISPNDNTLAQAEWVNTKDLNIEIDRNKFKIVNPFEAKAIAYFENSQWDKALNETINWLIDLPYSQRAVDIGSYIAACLTKDFTLAEEICKIGLKANPLNPTLINNFAYLLALQDKPTEARRIINRTTLIKQDNLTEGDIISLQATVGLIHFREKDFEAGKKFYELALENALKKQNDYLYAIGLINYLREAILSNSIDILSVYSKTKDVVIKLNNFEVNFLAKDVFELYDKRFLLI